MKANNIPVFKDLNKKQTQLLLAFAVALVALILISMLVLHIPVVAVCSIAICESVLAVLLNRIPIWVHGLIVIAQIVAGIINSTVVFMVLMVVVYIAAITVLFVWNKSENE